jgi:hypothetical protein
MSAIIEHPGPVNPFTGQSSGLPVTEYLLPAKIPPAVDLPPDFLSLAGLDSHDVAAELQFRGAGIVDPAVARFAKRLETFVPISLIHWQGGWLLRLALEGIKNYKSGNNFYRRPRPTTEELAGLQQFTGSSDALLDFMKHFGGLGENLPPASGSFADEAVRFAETPWSQQLSEPVPDAWRTALCIYLALNGDVLLLNSDGQVGWYFLGEGRIEKYSDSFADFLDRYTQFNIENEQSFDAYSASDPYLPRQST